jgi:tetratricopeptide (TPR) repeat protein
MPMPLNNLCVTWTILLILLGPAALASGRQNARERKAKGHYNRALNLDSSGDTDGAEAEYKLAITANGGAYPRASLQMSFLQRSQNRFNEAADSFEAYVTQTPRRDHTEDLDELKDLRRANALQERVARTDKPNLEDLLELASLVCRYARFRDGAPLAERALSLYPASVEARVVLGRLLTGAGQVERQGLILREATQMEPANAEAHNQLGWYYIGMFRDQDAADEFRKTLAASNGRLVGAWQGLGWALSALGELQEAIGAFHTYLRVGNVREEYKPVIYRQLEKLKSAARAR